MIGERLVLPIMKYFRNHRGAAKKYKYEETFLSS